MYLKALEIQGFKSFPDKTRLTFEKAVTAIVGPNGSGKSNISDALRWVMGEQSTKALRGGKMEDVIFGGTLKRNQLGFAEVSLILDNSAHTFAIEHSEVMITRRYYRSGESEYYINKQSVRLKDINELLMDTGLGREGYSIIGQGKIDDILSVKSTDRREVFEEAAGISRYRHRKEEAERKLLKAEDNLLRVNDKISELEMQVEPLRRQAEVAKKYLILRDELRGLEISVWIDKLEHLAERTQNLQLENQQAQAALEISRGELQALYAQDETFTERMRGKDMEAEQVREALGTVESACADTESSVAVLRANSASNTENIQRLLGEQKQQESRAEGLKAQIEERISRMDTIEKEKEERLCKIEELQADFEALTASFGKAAEEMAALFDRGNENSALLASERAVLSGSAEMLQELEDKNVQLLQDLTDADKRMEEAKKSAEASEKELEKAREEAASLQNIINGHNIRVESRRKKAEVAAEKKNRLTIEVGAIRSRIGMLSEMEKEFQGYSRAVKSVMQEASRGLLKGVHGTVAELIKTQDRYTLPIEIALGSAIQNIVVSTEDAAKAGINFLKRRDKGRATFLPMTATKGRRIHEPGLEDEYGVEGVAVDLISFDSQYKDIYADLLGRTVIVENIDIAVRISRKYGRRFRVVTMDGQVVNTSGSMTGGSASKDVGILSRANELTKLNGQLEKMKEDLRQAEEDLGKANRELDAAQYGLTVAGDNLRTFEDSILRLETEKRNYDVLFEALLNSKNALKADYEETKEKLKTSSDRIEQARANISHLEAEGEELRRKEAEMSAGQEELSTKRESLSETVSAIRAEIASLEAEKTALNQAVEEYTQLRREFTDDKRQQAELISYFEEKNETIKNEISVLEERLKALHIQADKKKLRLSEIAEEKLQVEAERTRHHKATQQKNSDLIEEEKHCSVLERRLAEAELEEKQIIDKLWDTYELSRTAAKEQAKTLESVPEASRRVGELKREISKLGTPNLGAIEEFERVNTRYTYLTDQRDDIFKAKEELDKIIEDITGEMKEIFAKEFELISESFKNTFTELFGGGKATLILEDPEDILNCGIEIKVQPPGKSLKTITLLSGGEKAFVAIALYFAIIKVRPVPFIVMDEIEAALDDANVIRFADYLRKLADKTQFLLITHRRGTMEEADVLYGVTMQEHGISRVLTIDLDEAEKTISK